METDRQEGKQIRTKITLSGSKKFVCKVRKIKEEIQELGRIIENTNENLKQLNKSMKEFNELNRK